MYLAPIVRAKTPVSAPARRLVGAIALPVSAAVMLPWLAGYAVYATVALAIRGVVKAPRALAEAVDYAGGVIVGR